jgi:heme/copper-type cytochrome/quinol oxidase subunit 2
MSMSMLVRRLSLFIFRITALLGLTAAPALAHHQAAGRGVPLPWLCIGIGVLIAMEIAFVKGGKRHEKAWAAAPLVALIFFASPVLWHDWQVAANRARRAGGDAIQVSAVARQWQWEFHTPAGTTTGELKVPVDRDVDVYVTSADTMHSFDVPSLNIQQDVFPTRPAHVVLHVTNPGRYPLLCSALCGGNQQEMNGVIVAARP